RSWTLMSLRERLVVPCIAAIAIITAVEVLHYQELAHPIEQTHATDLFRETGRPYLGVAVESFDLSRLASLQNSAGTSLSIVAAPIAGTADAPAVPASIGVMTARGTVPLMTWAPPSAVYERINRGELEPALLQLASELRELSRPVLVQITPDSSPGVDPRHFIAAWRHTVELFNREGAANVGWVWEAPSASNFETLYPGAGYVDWVAVRCTADESFSEQLRSLDLSLRSTNLPIMAVAPATSQDAAAVMKLMKQPDTFVRGIVLSGQNIEREPLAHQALLGDEMFTAPKPRTTLASADRSAVPHPSVVGAAGKFELLVDGKPFYIRGIAYNPGHDWRDGPIPLTRRQLASDFAKIRDMGGNTIRRYGTGWYDRNIFNVAAEHDLKVLYGFWLDQDIDYTAADAKLDEYRRRVEETVIAYRDHPGLIGWSIGNEAWGLLKHKFAKPHLVDVRHAYAEFVEELAQRIKELDPNHPVLTVHEHSWELAGAFVDFARLTPSVDVTGVNSYYEDNMAALNAIASRFDPQRPYLVSEFGPDGYWDATRTRKVVDGGLVEDSASAKAKLYARRWTDHIEAHRGANVGGVAYCWQDRYEGTSTWFGMNDMKGNAKPAYYAMRDVWKPAAQAADNANAVVSPTINRIRGPVEPIKDQRPFVVRVDLAGGPQDGVRYEWSIVGPKFTDVGQLSPVLKGAGAEVRLPSEPGWYRVLVRVTGPGGIDEMSYPVKVEAADDEHPTFAASIRNLLSK
ncbi:MAG TPA: glycoside hydrolase family 2 TIM barrel-domain containing protein, partial [Tepidisphaeraceae bacterium]